MDSLHLLVTTIVRHALESEPSGYVYLVDFASKRTLLRCPAPESRFRFKDPNPRGGLRGARGVSVWGDRVLIASNDTLRIFDRSWEQTAEFSEPWMGGIHDILAEEDGIWVTCTHGDLLMKLDWNGERLSSWSWRTDEKLAEELGFASPPHFDESLDYRDPDSRRAGVLNMVHLNGVSRGKEGLLLSFGRVLSHSSYRKQRLEGLYTKLALSLGLKRWAHKSVLHALEGLGTPGLGGKFDGSRSCLLLLRDDGSWKILKWISGAKHPNHNVIQLGRRLVYNDTNNSRVVAFCPRGSCDEQRVAIPGSPSFVRGLVHLRDQVVLVGSQAPAALYAVDLATGQVLDSCELDSGREAVYAITPLPFESVPVPSGLHFS